VSRIPPALASRAAGSSTARSRAAVIGPGVAIDPMQRSTWKPPSSADLSVHARLMLVLDRVEAVRFSGASGGGTEGPHPGSLKAPIRVCHPADVGTA